MSVTKIDHSQRDTIAALLARSGRDHVPIRYSFVQQGTGPVREPGPLAGLCTGHNERALDLYLLVRVPTSAEGYDVTLPASVWARMLGLSDSPNGRAAVSKTSRILEDRRLIRRERTGNRSRIVLLDEAGDDQPYQHPGKVGEYYFKLPHAYWTEEWHLRLSLPGKTVLLIALSLKDGFYLPSTQGHDWYGLSADTIQRGLNELQEHGLLDVVEEATPAPLSPRGVTMRRLFTLQPPFGPKGTAAAPEQDDELASVIELRSA